MKRIDFYEKKKTLHNEMLKAIVALFDNAEKNEIDLTGTPHNAWVVLAPDGCESTIETSVEKVKCEYGMVFIEVGCWDDYGWISCEHAGIVLMDTLDTLYDAVFDYFSES